MRMEALDGIWTHDLRYPPLLLLRKQELGITKPSPRKESYTASVTPRSLKELQQFCDWLKAQGKTHWTIKQTKNYAKKYGYILNSGNCSEIMTLSPRNRHHAMAALASLAKFQGQYDTFQLLKQSYNRKWSSRQESLQSFNHFFNPELSLESMLQQISEMVSKTPRTMGR